MPTPNRLKPNGVRERIRPTVELDPVMAHALALYMKDQEILQKSQVFRKAIRQLVPKTFFEQAEKAVRKNRR